ncbi:MAG TPA: FAD binding domain-containing protein [Gemmatimonadaceae bacterium]|nr:FAD binding domain-containing protein [Gemmatimonadaceae bacterium]
MGIPDLTYQRPASLAEACALGRRLGSAAAYLAGGTELIPDFQRGVEPARTLIALDAIGELRGISVRDGVLRIGALATVAEVADSTLVRARLPAFADAARAIGSPPIRSLATVGGNFCRAVPCADLPPAAIVAGVRLRLVGLESERELDAVGFFIGPRQTVLEPGELLAELLVPAQPPRSGASYQRFARRAGAALAVAAVAARVVLDADGRIAGARIALGAVAPVPLLVPRAASLLEGEAPSEALFARAAAECAERALPVSDVRGSEAFRRELVAVLARRALAEAHRRAAEAGR